MARVFLNAALILLIAGPGAAAAQSGKAEVGQVGQTDRNEADEVMQIGVGQGRSTAEQVQQIAPSNGNKVLIDPLAGSAPRTGAVQQSGGRDLCDPSVPEAARRKAGLACSERIQIERRATTGLADDPLLKPPRQDLEQGFDALNLGDDVPATVILQQ